jgi:amphiphysin
MHDEKMTDAIPVVVELISTFFNPIMNTMYAVQIDLYQHLYASVYEYATSQGLNNTDNVVDECQALYEPIRQRAESEIKSLREGKIAKTPGRDSNGSRPGLYSRKSSANGGSFASVGASAGKLSSGIQSGLKSPPPPPTSSPSPSSTYQKLPLSSSSTMMSLSQASSYVTPSTADIKKKRPPPPPPPKPSVGVKPEFVVAMYDFAGQSEGDLAFAAGTKIKVVKKTDSMEDWWEGEVHGRRGMFPRNYCQ